MNAAVLAPRVRERTPSVFDLHDRDAWLRWRDRKLAARARGAADLIVEVRDPRRLSRIEAAAIVERCRRTNMAIYASRADDDAAPDVARRLGAQLGLATLDANPLAARDGIARIAVDARKASAGFIPYTSRRMRWHTDGYYNAPSRPVRAMILHCVRAAASGGDTALLDPELAWLMLRDAGDELVRSLMRPDALTIPERNGRSGVAREAVSGPVFSTDAASGDLHMRYTARRRSVRWRCDATTGEAAARLLALMDHDAGCVVRARLEPGMGLVCNNVLHERTAFEEDPAHPRLILRARFLERIAGTEGAWARLAAS
jgi:alpha-ketoglutarate-dependent taurine dioxygenase